MQQNKKELELQFSKLHSEFTIKHNAWLNFVSKVNSPNYVEREKQLVNEMNNADQLLINFRKAHS